MTTLFDFGIANLTFPHSLLMVWFVDGRTMAILRREALIGWDEPTALFNFGLLTMVVLDPNTITVALSDGTVRDMDGAMEIGRNDVPWLFLAGVSSQGTFWDAVGAFLEFGF